MYNVISLRFRGVSRDQNLVGSKASTLLPAIPFQDGNCKIDIMMIAADVVLRASCDDIGDVSAAHQRPAHAVGAPVCSQCVRGAAAGRPATPVSSHVVPPSELRASLYFHCLVALDLLFHWPLRLCSV